jgi:hypothetical protein
MVWFSAVTWPGSAVMVPRPSTLPMATTAFPTMTEEELPIGTVVSPDAFCSVAGRGALPSGQQPLVQAGHRRPPNSLFPNESWCYESGSADRAPA